MSVMAKINSNVAVLLTSASISMYGDWLYVTALTALIVQHGGVTALALYFSIRQIITIFTQPFIGILIAKANKKFLMIFCDLVRALLIVGIAFATVQENPSYIMILILAMLTGFVGNIFDVTRRIVVPVSIEKRHRNFLNSLDGGIATSALIVSPAIGGLIMSFFSKDVLFFVNIVFFLISAAILFFLSVKDSQFKTDTETKVLPELKETAIHLWRSPIHFILTLMSLCSHMIVGATWILVSYVALNVLPYGEASIGYLMSLLGIGSFIGMVLAGYIKEKQLISTVILAILILVMINMLWIVGLYCHEILIFVSILLGVSANIFEAPCWTLLQNHTSENKYGAVFGLFDSVTLSGVGYGSLLTSILLTMFGVTTAIITLSFHCLFIWGIGLINYRRYYHDFNSIS